MWPVKISQIDHGDFTSERLVVEASIRFIRGLGAPRLDDDSPVAVGRNGYAGGWTRHRVGRRRLNGALLVPGSVQTDHRKGIGAVSWTEPAIEVNCGVCPHAKRETKSDL